MKRIIYLILPLFFAICIISCSGDEDLGYFQNNDPEPEYKLFSLLDDYPALKDLFSNLDQNEFNHKTAELANNNLQILSNVLSQVDKLIGSNPGHAERPVTNSIGNLRTILNRVINQDELDRAPLVSYPGYPSNYTEEAYKFIDKVRASDMDMSGSIVGLLNKLLGYIDARYTPEELEQKVQELIVDLREEGPDSLSNALVDLTEFAGKALLQADDNLYLYDHDGNSNTPSVIRTGRSEIDLLNDIDTGLGNTVRGIDAMLSGLADLSSDATIREDLYTIIRKALSIPSLTANGKGFSAIIKDLIFNIEDWFTASVGIEPANKFDSATDYNIDSAEAYSNAELGNTLKELLPGLVSLFIRADRSDSIIADDSTGLYPLELLAKGLNSSNIDFDSLDLEGSLYKMIRYDGRLRNRLGSSDNPADPNYAYKVSMLDQLLFLLASVDGIGFKDRVTAADDPEGLINHLHGHGAGTGGILTLNDALFNMGTGTVLGLDAYVLALNRGAMGQPAGKFLHRSSQAFDKSSFTFNTGKPYGDHPFLMDADFPALQLMSGHLIGDAGSPAGGSGTVPASGTLTDADWNSYKAYSADGKGDTNTLKWMIGLLSRTCWRGEGPYYSTEGSENTAGNTTKYYTPGGEVYAEVDKSGADWIYSNSKYQSEWNTDYYLIELGLVNVNDTLASAPVNTASPVIIKAGGAEIGRDDGLGKISGPGIVEGSGSINYADGAITFNLASEPAGASSITADYTGSIAVVDEPLAWTTVSQKEHFAPGSSLYYSTSGAKVWEKLMANTDNAGYITVKENPAISGASRECATHEEAIFKNLQWLLNEKKILLIIPMRIDAGGIGAALYVTAEFNGLLGIVNGAKVLSADPGSGTIADGNGKWAKNGGYGESYIPGDGRMMILCDSLGQKLLPYLYNNFFGEGTLMPGVLGGNIDPVKMLAFLRTDADSLSSLEVGPGSAYWNDRNAIAPLLMALLGELHKQSSAEKNPFNTVAGGLIPAITKPMKYYQKDNLIANPADPAYIPYPRNCWKPRIADGNNYLLPTSHLGPSESVSAYYLPKANPTLLTLLSESGYKKCDGLLPLISNTDMLAGLLKFLQKLGGSAFDDTADWDYTKTIDENFGNWGARRKIFFGLEQLATSIRSMKGEAENRGYTLYGYPSWVVYGNENEIRSADFTIESFIEDYITNGLAELPEERPLAEDWHDFNEAIETFVDLFSDNGQTAGRYNMTENIIGLTDIVLSGVSVTFSEISALRHTMGAVFSWYDKSEENWKYDSELDTVLTEELPWILEVFEGRYDDLIKLAKNALIADGLGIYLAENLRSSYPAGEIIEQLYDFIGIDLISRYDSVLWNDLAELLPLIGDLLVKDTSVFDEFYYYNKNITESVDSMDPFSALGKLLSR